MTGDTLKIALKEWASVCDALAGGRQIVLLRKGGIYESAGEFEVEHRAFLLFPTYLHQSLRMLKTEAHSKFELRSEEPAQVTLSAMGEVTDIVQVKSRAAMDAIDAEHIWTPPLIDMRFSYRPENPLYLLLVRAYRLANPVTIENTPAYAGCKSWVPLETPIDVSGATPVLDDQTYEQRRTQIMSAVASA